MDQNNLDLQHTWSLRIPKPVAPEIEANWLEIANKDPQGTHNWLIARAQTNVYQSQNEVDQVQKNMVNMSYEEYHMDKMDAEKVKSAYTRSLNELKALTPEEAIKLPAFIGWM